MPKSVHVVLGSASDKEMLAKSGFVKIVESILGREAIEFSICSAHRNAARLEAFVTEAEVSEVKVFVGIAGLAAALPGALAGLSGMSVPVIAVPLDEHGVDSCLYMPPGVPVLTAGVGKTGLKNAAIAVCQIVAQDSDGETTKKALGAYLTKNHKSPQFDINPLEY